MITPNQVYKLFSSVKLDEDVDTVAVRYFIICDQHGGFDASLLGYVVTCKDGVCEKYKGLGLLHAYTLNTQAVLADDATTRAIHSLIFL